MSEPGGDPSSGISLGDLLRLPKRHPACRRREAQSSSCTERENLAGDAKRKGTASTVGMIFQRYAGHCHGTSGLRSRWWSGSEGDDENQLQRIPVPI
jgi:hypothetical protein